MTAALIALQSPVQAQSARPPLWTIEGEVQLGKRAGPLPVARQWVVVHRIASDSAGNVSGGPLDSARTDASGRFRIRYPRVPGEATYIAITTYQGVSYISAPLVREEMRGDDATIMVFDTISPPYPIKVAGRHLIITAPGTDDRRRVVEVFELLNDSTHTVMGTEENPVWRIQLARGAKDFEINPVGDISPAMAKFDGEWLRVFSPISPGLRQISFSYSLGPEAFPLVMSVPDSSTVFELLVQEPDAAVEGGGFTEVAPVTQQGVPFRRLLAQNVPAGATIRFSMPVAVSSKESRLITIVAGGVGALMLAALGVVLWKRRRPRATVPRVANHETAAEALIRELATMDAEFEGRTNATEAERADFQARRSALKTRLAAVLAEQKAHA